MISLSFSLAADLAALLSATAESVTCADMAKRSAVPGPNAGFVAWPRGVGREGAFRQG